MPEIVCPHCLSGISIAFLRRGEVAVNRQRAGAREPPKRLEVSEAFSGCAAYQIRSDALMAEGIFRGDYAVVHQADAYYPPDGKVLAWVDGHGEVIMRLRAGALWNGDWVHELRDGDQVIGLFVGIIRVDGEAVTRANRLVGVAPPSDREPTGYTAA